jgi:hypothetical protein
MLNVAPPPGTLNVTGTEPTEIAIGVTPPKVPTYGAGNGYDSVVPALHEKLSIAIAYILK